MAEYGWAIINVAHVQHSDHRAAVARESGHGGLRAKRS